jgi:hypothetical protein
VNHERKTAFFIKYWDPEERLPFFSKFAFPHVMKGNVVNLERVIFLHKNPIVLDWALFLCSLSWLLVTAFLTVGLFNLTHSLPLRFEL